MISLPKMPYINRIYMVLANPSHTASHRVRQRREEAQRTVSGPLSAERKQQVISRWSQNCWALCRVQSTQVFGGERKHTSFRTVSAQLCRVWKHSSFRRLVQAYVIQDCLGTALPRPKVIKFSEASASICHSGLSQHSSAASKSTQVFGGECKHMSVRSPLRWSNIFRVDQICIVYTVICTVYIRHIHRVFDDFPAENSYMHRICPSYTPCIWWLPCQKHRVCMLLWPTLFILDKVLQYPVPKWLLFLD